MCIRGPELRGGVLVMARRTLGLLGLLAAAACGAPAEGMDGVETGPCIAGECFDGLQCLSDLCVAGDGETEGADGGPDGGDGGPGGGPGGGAGDGADGADDGPDDGADGGPDDGVDDGPDDGVDDDPDAGDDTAGVCDPSGAACEPLGQDCMACAKCSPYGTNGNWNAARCVGVNANPAAVGESCIVIDSPTSGIDNCEAGSMCWDVDVDTLTGTCLEMCTGPASSPSCETPGTVCAVGNDGILPLCLPACDPLEQNCPAGEGCYILNEASICAPTSGAVGSGESCGSVNACSPGLGCSLGGGGCDATLSCCGAYCDESAPDCDIDLECVGPVAGVGICAST